MNESRGRFIAYAVLTGLVVLSQGASGVLDLIGFPPIAEGISKLGYPSYILTILGPAKLIGVAVIAAPGLLRLKEWAYAGFTIDFIGAFLSHVFAADYASAPAPLIVLAFLMGSYFLRPANRTLAPPLN